MVLDLRQAKAFQIPLTDVGDTRTCHFHVAYHFTLGNRERKTVTYLYTGIVIFVHLVGKSLQTSKVIWARCALVYSDYITPS